MSNRRALAPIAGAAIVTGAVLAYRKAVRTTVKTPAGEVSIIDPDDNVRVHRSGAVGSVQEAEILVERDFLERIWNADSLELLAPRLLGLPAKDVAGIIRMHYSHDARTVTAFSLLPLLRFGTPRYETDEGEGRVTWPIDRGLLVAREGSRRGPPARLGEALRPRWHRRRDRRHQGRGADDRPRRGQQLLSGIRGRGRFARLGPGSTLKPSCGST